MEIIDVKPINPKVIDIINTSLFLTIEALEAMLDEIEIAVDEGDIAEVATLVDRADEIRHMMAENVDGILIADEQFSILSNEEREFIYNVFKKSEDLYKEIVDTGLEIA